MTALKLRRQLEAMGRELARKLAAIAIDLGASPGLARADGATGT